MGEHPDCESHARITDFLKQKQTDSHDNAGKKEGMTESPVTEQLYERIISS
jgi:hypothetical protein